MQLLTIAAMLIAACGVILALQNNIPVVVTFLLWRFDSSLAMVLLLSLALGGFIVALVSTPATLRRQWAAARQNKRITELEKICNDQKDTIADLERRVPVVEPASEVSRPYVGLKQFIGSMGNGGSNSQNSPPIV